MMRFRLLLVGWCVALLRSFGVSLFLRAVSLFVRTHTFSHSYVTSILFGGASGAAAACYIKRSFIRLYRSPLIVSIQASIVNGNDGTPFNSLCDMAGSFNNFRFSS